MPKYPDRGRDFRSWKPMRKTRTKHNHHHNHRHAAPNPMQQHKKAVKACVDRIPGPPVAITRHRITTNTLGIFGGGRQSMPAMGHVNDETRKKAQGDLQRIVRRDSTEDLVRRDAAQGYSAAQHSSADVHPSERTRPSQAAQPPQDVYVSALRQVQCAAEKARRLPGPGRMELCATGSQWSTGASTVQVKKKQVVVVDNPNTDFPPEPQWDEVANRLLRSLPTIRLKGQSFLEKRAPFLYGGLTRLNGNLTPQAKTSTVQENQASVQEPESWNEENPNFDRQSSPKPSVISEFTDSHDFSPLSIATEDQSSSHEVHPLLRGAAAIEEQIPTFADMLNVRPASLLDRTDFANFSLISNRDEPQPSHKKVVINERDSPVRKEMFRKSDQNTDIMAEMSFSRYVRFTPVRRLRP